jgi:hypothetical protein
MSTDHKGQKLCTTGGNSVESARESQTNETGQHESYIVLCPDERAKGFVRPYRNAYKHTVCGSVRGIAEVMGHKRFAGHITEQVIAGAALVRVDVPEVVVRTNYADPPTFKTVAGYSKLIGVGSIYCITPTTEEVARRAATELARYDSDPLPVALPAERQIPASVGATTVEALTDDDFEDNDDDEDFR